MVHTGSTKARILSSATWSYGKQIPWYGRNGVQTAVMPSWISLDGQPAAIQNEGKSGIALNATDARVTLRAPLPALKMARASFQKGKTVTLAKDTLQEAKPNSGRGGMAVDPIRENVQEDAAPADSPAIDPLEKEWSDTEGAEQSFGGQDDSTEHEMAADLFPAQAQGRIVPVVPADALPGGHSHERDAPIAAAGRREDERDCAEEPSCSPLTPPEEHERREDISEAGLLCYEKWWFRRFVDICVNGELLTGMPIYKHAHALRVVNGEFSYFIPFKKVDYIRTPDGLNSKEEFERE